MPPKGALMAGGCPCARQHNWALGLVLYFFLDADYFFLEETFFLS